MSKIEKHKIGSYIEQVTGFPFESSKFNQEQNGIRLLRGINITRGRLRFDSDNEMYYDDREADFSKFHLAENDIVISMDGSLVGRNYAMVNSEFLPLLLVQRVARIRANGTNLDQNYLYQFISSDYFIKYVDSVKTSSGIPHISSKQINEFEVPFFPVEEQKGIADILSTCDEAIEKLTKLIASKEKQKKGLMQNLLTGKVRFKEFGDEEWIETTVGEISKFENGKGHENSITEDGSYIVVNSKFVASEGREFKRSNDCLVPLQENDIVMVMSDVPNGKALAKCFLIEKNDKYTLNQRICKLTVQDNDASFMYYLINRNEFYLQFDSGVGQTNLRKDEVLACPLFIPQNIKEQQKIASVIKEASIEIKLLNTELDNFRLQKKGLMQQLLTGKIRVIK